MIKNKKPHIVIFNPDSYRGDILAHMGHQAAVTPNFDKIIANDAVSFRNAFCQNPICTPSRCSFMSGWYPHVTGHRTMRHMLREHEPVLLKTLKDNGYYVWWGGKNDLVPGQKSFDPYCTVRYRPTKREFNYFAPKSEWSKWRGSPGSDTYYSFFFGKLDKGNNDYFPDLDWDYVNAAVRFIKNAPSDQPLCLFLPISYPHPPYAVEEPWYSLIDRSKVPQRAPSYENWTDKPSILSEIRTLQKLENWSEEKWRETQAVYYGMCARVDYQFGLLMDALRQAGIYDESAVFMFSDHGDFTGDYGLVEKTHNTFQDCLVRVPFIFKPPRWLPIRPGIREDLIELIDFPATVEELVGISPEHTHFGRSLVPLLTGKGEKSSVDAIDMVPKQILSGFSHRDVVFCEGGRLTQEEHCVEPAAKKPESLYQPKASVFARNGPEPTKAIMVRSQRYKYVMRLYELDELYDLKADPQELHNRINAPELETVVRTINDSLLKFFLETGDVVPFDKDKR